MKKNKMMRLASLLLVLTLMSTCAISGTFAKYVTSDSASDSARVAKWGVVIKAADNSNFETEYATDDNAYSGTLSVKSSANPADNVVAPGTGTQDNEAEKMVFTISGTPEVATKINISMTVTSDIFLKAGTYKDWTTGGNTDDTFTSDADYYPVVFTLTQTASANGKLMNPVSGTLSDIETALETYANNAYYAPNTDLSATFELTWEWKFSNEDDGIKKSWADEADTLLGNLATGGQQFTNGVNSSDYSTEIEYEITFTVVQVD